MNSIPQSHRPSIWSQNRIHAFVALKDVCYYNKQTQPWDKRMEKTNGIRK